MENGKLFFMFSKKSSFTISNFIMNQPQFYQILLLSLIKTVVFSSTVEMFDNKCYANCVIIEKYHKITQYLRDGVGSGWAYSVLYSVCFGAS